MSNLRKVFQYREFLIDCLDRGPHYLVDGELIEVSGRDFIIPHFFRDEDNRGDGLCEVGVSLIRYLDEGILDDANVYMYSCEGSWHFKKKKDSLGADGLLLINLISKEVLWALRRGLSEHGVLAHYSRYDMVEALLVESVSEVADSANDISLFDMVESMRSNRSAFNIVNGMYSISCSETINLVPGCDVGWLLIRNTAFGKWDCFGPQGEVIRQQSLDLGKSLNISFEEILKCLPEGEYLRLWCSERNKLEKLEQGNIVSFDSGSVTLRSQVYSSETKVYFANIEWVELGDTCPRGGGQVQPGDLKLQFYNGAHTSVGWYRDGVLISST